MNSREEMVVQTQRVINESGDIEEVSATAQGVLFAYVSLHDAVLNTYRDMLSGASPEELATIEKFYAGVWDNNKKIISSMMINLLNGIIGGDSGLDSQS